MNVLTDDWQSVPANRQREEGQWPVCLAWPASLNILVMKKNYLLGRKFEEIKKIIKDVMVQVL